MSKKNDNSSGNGAIALALIALLLLPFVGVYFLTRKEPEKKILGGVILISFVIVLLILKFN